MKLSLESIQNKEAWKGYHLPEYDPAVIAENTKKNPQWLHFGPGNIFRIFPAALCQKLIECGKTDTGIVCCEGYDDETELFFGRSEYDSPGIDGIVHFEGEEGGVRPGDFYRVKITSTYDGELIGVIANEEE
jgi:hypothetical protein